MKYTQTIVLKNGKEALIRNGDAPDGAAVYENFNQTHAETDYLLSYPDENSYDPEQEAHFLEEKTQSGNEIELVALVDGRVAGTAGIEAVGKKFKLMHRAEFGISILREYWELGLGRALARACISCAKEAGYAGTERRRRKRAGRILVPEPGLRGVRQEPQRLQVADGRLSGTALHAAGAIGGGMKRAG